MRGSRWTMIPGLKKFRELYGYTQKDVADLLGVSQKQVYLWERRGVKPRDETLLSLCDIFQCVLSDLILGPPDDQRVNKARPA